MREKYVSVENAAFGYDKKIVLDNVNISIKKGEIVAIIGPNGVGKSTILKSIATQLKLKSGALFLDDKSLYSYDGRELSKKLSVLMTERVNPELYTSYDVVALGRYPYTGKLGLLSERDREVVEESMRLVNINNISNELFSTLSDGQKQRVMLARAISQEPELLILDEPTAFLDIKYKLELLSLLKYLADTKKTTICMSLHEIDLAYKIADMVLCIKNDRVDKYGMPEEILTSEYISELYQINKGCYNYELGCVELEKVNGQSKTFVIGGGGSGIALYRRLNKRQIPFAAGILHENDIEYHIAKALAVDVIFEKSFECISQDKLDEAKRYIDGCENVYACVEDFGSMNMRNKELISYARDNNKLRDFLDI